MIDVFKLASLQENADSYASAPVAPYEFRGSMDDMTSSINYMLANEAANHANYAAISNEILVEAAMNGESQYMAVSEGVFGTITANVKKFIDKIIAMLKGVIAKLKAFFYKLTGKTDKWLKVMEPRIKEAAGRSGNRDVTYNMHNWNRDYVLNGIVDAMEKTQSKTDYEAAAKGKSIAFGYDKLRGANADDAEVKSEIDKLESATKALKEEEEAQTDKTLEEFCSAMDVSATDFEGAYKEIDQKATGGEKDNVNITEKFGIDSMMNSIKDSKKNITRLQKVYDQELKKVSNCKKVVDSLEKTWTKMDTLTGTPASTNESAGVMNEASDKLPTELVAKAKTYVGALCSRLTKELTLKEGIYNNLRARNTKYIQAMTGEFMNALSKYAGYKGKKEEEE